MISVTLVCGTNPSATSKLCSILGSIGFNGYEPYTQTKIDSRFNSFASQRLSLFINELVDSTDLCPDSYVHFKAFADDLERFAETLSKKRVYLYHSELYRLIPYFKNVFNIRVIFTLDTLIEPDNECSEVEWNRYYVLRAKYFSSVTGLIQSQSFPYLFVNTNEFFQNKVGLFRKIINFHNLKAGDDANTFNVLQRDAIKLLQRISPRVNALKKVAIVTAYAKESTETLLKCIHSVKNQSVECVHILIADGFPNESIVQLSNQHLLHISLPENIGFNQCGVGVELAFALGFDVVGILDADNWYEPDHIEISLDLINHKNADVVFAKRKVVFPDGELLSVEDPQDSTGAFADTNCLVLTRKVAAITPVWLMWPKAFGAGEDRAVSICIRMLNFNVLMNTDETVWYQTNWAHHYKLQNKLPVAPLRRPAAEFGRSFEQDKFFESTGFNLPIKQADNASPNDGVDYSKLGIVLPYVEKNTLVNDVCQLGNSRNILIVHNEKFLDTDFSGFKKLMLPDHATFKHTSWALGASVMFQTGCEVLILLDSIKSLADVDIDAMLNISKENNVDVIFKTENIAGVFKLNHVMVTKKAKFFAVIWSQLNHIAAKDCMIEACESYLYQKNIRYIHLK
jgi:glycosyltransferase involved in cell wall biosynthesis